MRGSTLLAQPFDAKRRVLAGDPRPVADGVSRALNHAAFSVSATGVLIYRIGRLVNRQLTWVDRGGTPLATVGSLHDTSEPLGLRRSLQWLPESRRPVTRSAVLGLEPFQGRGKAKAT